ncbi:hypothetical protein Bbelb_397500 [Branchiostoma belcheri]|nr:hypothetical protein Bbelb_397500 [Branchiostoma belcheri]
MPTLDKTSIFSTKDRHKVSNGEVEGGERRGMGSALQYLALSHGYNRTCFCVLSTCKNVGKRRTSVHALKDGRLRAGDLEDDRRKHGEEPSTKKCGAMVSLSMSGTKDGSGPGQWKSYLP